MSWAGSISGPTRHSWSTSKTVAPNISPSPLSNIWGGTTLNIVDRTGSLNKVQSVPNDDGSYTYVISPVDPGVANWIDSDGLREGVLTLRMAEFGEDGPTPDLGATGRVVALDRLDDEAPGLAR